uniref:Uncharacterized protein n=1 Tax=Ditylenchus dipsaci TaxID=166011 RepID=A0A915CW29_9BILA
MTSTTAVKEATTPTTESSSSALTSTSHLNSPKDLPEECQVVFQTLLASQKEVKAQEMLDKFGDLKMKIATLKKEFEAVYSAAGAMEFPDEQARQTGLKIEYARIEFRNYVDSIILVDATPAAQSNEKTRPRAFSSFSREIHSEGVQPAPVITSKRARQSTSVVLSRSPNKPEEQSTIVKVVEEATAKDKTVYGNSPVKKK